MTQHLSAQITALRARVPLFAEQVFLLLHSSVWRGWKPASIKDVEVVMHLHLDAVAEGCISSSSGGVFARVEFPDSEHDRHVTVGFVHDIEAHIDPTDGRAYVLPLHL